jgi:GNAT superfamily N-acetyltransferase
MLIRNKLLGNATVNNGLDLAVFYTPDVNGSYAASAFLRGYAEYASSGLIGHYIPLLTPSFKHPVHAVFAIAEDKEKHKNVVGVIAFTVRTNLRQAWIELVFTPQRLRGRGISKILYAFLEKQCKEVLDIETVSGYIHINNTSMIQAAKKMNLEPKYYKMSKRL